MGYSHQMALLVIFPQGGASGCFRLTRSHGQGPQSESIRHYITITLDKESLGKHELCSLGVFVRAEIV